MQRSSRDIHVGWRPEDGAPDLTVQKVGGRASRGLTLGGDPGTWAVRHGDAVVATARIPLAKFEMSIDIGGRQLTFRMPDMLRFTPPTEFHVVADTTGEEVVTGARISGGRDRNLVCEQWSVTVAGREPVEFVYRLREPRTFSFTDLRGTPLVRLGHDASFTAKAGDSWLRVLLRLWGGALGSTDRYLAQVHERAVDAPLLTLIGVWMERTSEGRYPTSADT
jgi:hypothetical protein